MLSARTLLPLATSPPAAHDACTWPPWRYTKAMFFPVPDGDDRCSILTPFRSSVALEMPRWENHLSNSSSSGLSFEVSTSTGVAASCTRLEGWRGLRHAHCDRWQAAGRETAAGDRAHQLLALLQGLDLTQDVVVGIVLQR